MTNHDTDIDEFLSLSAITLENEESDLALRQKNTFKDTLKLINKEIGEDIKNISTIKCALPEAGKKCRQINYKKQRKNGKAL